MVVMTKEEIKQKLLEYDSENGKWPERMYEGRGAFDALFENNESLDEWEKDIERLEFKKINAKYTDKRMKGQI